MGSDHESFVNTDEVFDASPDAADSSFSPEQESTEIDPSFWDATIVVTFTDTTYLPNEYTIDSDLHDLEVLAYAYENNDQYARASISEEDALRVWGWIIKKRSGRFPNDFELIDKKAKRLRRREFGPIADLIDCRVTPIQSGARSGNSNRSAYSGSAKRKPKSRSEIQDAAQHIQEAAQIIGNAASEGVKEVAQKIQDAAKDVDLTQAKQGLDELTKNAQIIAGSAEISVRKWLKDLKKADKKKKKT